MNEIYSNIDQNFMIKKFLKKKKILIHIFLNKKKIYELRILRVYLKGRCESCS
jgi:hypothetical protein